MRSEINLSDGYSLSISKGKFGNGFTLWHSGAKGKIWIIDASCFSKDRDITICPKHPAIIKIINKKHPVRLRIKCRALIKNTRRTIG